METLPYTPAPGCRNRPARVWSDDDELVITDLANENAALRELTDQLVDLVADLTLETVRLRLLYDRELLSRFYADIEIARLKRRRRGTHGDGTPEPSPS